MHAVQVTLAAALTPWFTLLGSPVTGLELLAFVLSLWMVARGSPSVDSR